MKLSSLNDTLDQAFAARRPLLDDAHRSAVRLFSGFYEGCPDLVIDLYGRSLVLHDFSKEYEQGSTLPASAQQFALEQFPWIECVVRKQRFSEEVSEKRGHITFGSAPETSIHENNIQYALDLMINQDASFYLDTRNLRSWLTAHSQGKDVLNTFAYTGSLGVAALAGGAARVVQTDRNRRYLSLARESAVLNRLDLGKMKLRAADFFSEVGNFKRKGERFDLVLLDPPFFSVTDSGTVDMLGESSRLINKLRPLVRDGGHLIVINNALFLSGEDYMSSLKELCKDGFLDIEETIPVPEDICGYPDTHISTGPADPSPFNHSTKITVLKVSRKENSK